MTAWQFLIDLHKLCHFQSREGSKVGRASNSELKRWIQSRALVANGEALMWNEPMDFPIHSLVLFTNKKVTLL